MNIDQLKAFQKVALTGSFTKAASELFLTQPAVSQQIQTLESSLGTILFDRSGKKVNLTSEGAILLSYTERLFSLYEEIKTLFDHLQNLKKGKITIGSTAVIGTYFMPKLIGHYNRQYPNIEIDLRMGNSHHIIRLVLDGKVDLGFAGWMADQPRLKNLLIHQEKLLVVSSSDNPLPAKNRVSVAELGKIPFIWREKGTQTRELVERWFEKYGTADYPQKSIELQNVEAAKRTVVEGYGITVIPEIAVRREIHLGLLKRINLERFDLTFDYYLFYLKGKILSKAAFAFLEMLFAIRLLSHTDNLKEYLSKPTEAVY